MRRTTAILALCAAAVPALSQGAGKWETSRPEKARRAMAKGKNLSVFPSPDKKYALIWRDENEVGDFFWRSLYLKSAQGYARLGSYNELGGVKWSPDSRLVTFRARAASGPDTMDHLEVAYRPATRVIRSRVVKTEKLEGAPG